MNNSISIIIPTIGRAEEMRRLLISFEAQTMDPLEIIIIDQGEGEMRLLTKEFVSLPIQVINVDEASLTKARNFGVEKSTGDIVGFLDDDIILEKEYIENIFYFFETNQHALGVQGIITDFEKGHTEKVGGNVMVYQCYNIFAKFFLLNQSSRHNKLLLSGRNQYASRPVSVQPCEWLSGIGNYRRSVFESHHFDEYLRGYAFGEDKLFSYPLFEKFGQVLFVDPTIKCTHVHAQEGRPSDKDWVRMKVRYTYYLWSKVFRKRGPIAILAYYWANVGDLISVCISTILMERPLRFLWWHITEYVHLLWTHDTQV
jgi:glucosyl-dolichyl phosphate glucuronosyltransferase